MKKEYLRTNDKELLSQINDYIENVINKDRRYFHHLSEYDFDDDTLSYLLA